MSQYQVFKETPPGSGVFEPQGGPVEAADPSDDPVANAEAGCISAILAAQQLAEGGCWAADKVG